MPALTKFRAFVEYLAEGGMNFASDQLRVMPTDALPSLDAETADLDISILSNLPNLNNYPTCLNVSVTDSSQTGGEYKLTLSDVTLTADDTVGPFRWVVLYNNANQYLIGFADYGTNITLKAGESIKIDFDQVSGAITVT